MIEQINNYLVRPANKKDSKRIWEIRNHPISRKYSGNSEKIFFARHNLWFKNKYFNGQDNYCFVLKSKDGLVVGYCRLDLDNINNYYIISIAIDPNHHGQGLGHRLMRDTLSQFARWRKGIFAEIKKENLGSIRLFQKNNFKIFKEDEKNYYLKHK